MPGFSLPGAEWTRSRREAPAPWRPCQCPLWQRGRENAPASKLRRTLGIVPLRLLTMRLGEKGPDTGFIRRGPQRRNGYRAGAIHYANNRIVPCLPVGLTELILDPAESGCCLLDLHIRRSLRPPFIASKVGYGHGLPPVTWCALKATRLTTNGNALGDGCVHRLKTRAQQ